MELADQVLVARRNIEAVLVRAGVTVYAAASVTSALEAGAELAVLVVEWDDLASGHVGGGTPARGDLVVFALGDGAGFAVLVYAAAYGAGKVALVGEMGGVAPTFVGVTALTGVEWKCWACPSVNMLVSMPREDRMALGTSDGLDLGSWPEVLAEQGPSHIPLADRVRLAQDAWAEFDEQFGSRLYGALLAEAADERTFVPLSVREGGWRKRLRWRVKGGRERVARWLAPWLVGELYARRESGLGCPHEWTDATNEVVCSGEVCTSCGAIRAGKVRVSADG